MTEDGSPELIVPAGIHLDDVAERRLRATWVEVADDVDVLVAPTATRRSGVSSRVEAERAAMTGRRTEDVSDRSFVGAALAKPGRARVDGSHTVSVDADARVRRDPSAVSVDPWRVPVAAVASVDARPPFPSRAVVLILGTEVDDDVADLARTWSNALVRSEVEVVFAVPESPVGLRLAPPCLPSTATLDAVSPDVVIGLDTPAVEMAECWHGAPRAFTVVTFVHDTTTGAVLHPRGIGGRGGRRRAVLGRGAHPRDVVALVRRLCSGPQAEPPILAMSPPSGPDAARVTPAVGDPRPRRLSITVVPARGEHSSTRALRALASHLEAAGHRVREPSRRRADARHREDDDLVVVDVSTGSERFIEATQRRRARGRPTVAWAPEAAAVPSDARLVVVAGVDDLTSVARAGRRVFLTPTLLHSDEWTALADVRDRGDGPPVIGWLLGSRDRPLPGTAKAATPALAEFLDAHPDALVRVIAPAGGVPGRIDSHPRVRVFRNAPTPRELQSWSWAVATPAEDAIERDGDRFAIASAVAAGLPVVMGRADAMSMRGLDDPTLVVAHSSQADEWSERFEMLLDPHVRSVRADRAISVASSLLGPDASRRVVRRFLGWATR